MTHLVESFRRELDAVPDTDFPDCLERVDTAELEQAAGGPIGVAAFPVSHGLYADPAWDHSELPPFPRPGQGLMIVGNHPHSKAAALARLREHGAHGDPDRSTSMMPYWRELYRLLDDAGINRHTIFATNVHPAFFTRTRGRVPSTGNEAWFAHARRLLTLQITSMKPRLLLVFGDIARDELARLGVGMSPLVLNDPVSMTVGGRRLTGLHARHPSARTTGAQREQRAEVLASVWQEAWA